MERVFREAIMNEEIDNILVRQKDFILNLISRGRLVEARCCLSCVSELWKANNYEYKTNEIIERIRKEKKEYKEPF